MKAISRLERAERPDKVVMAGQRLARMIGPGKIRDGLHGVWLGHPLHPLLVQAAAGTWLSASIVDFMADDETSARRLTAAALAASAPAIAAGAVAGGANHAEAVPHLIEPGWHHLSAPADLPAGRPVRMTLGEIPVVAVRVGGRVHALADRCSHMSGPLSDGDLADGCLTCPWHGSVFRISDGSVARGPATAPQPVFDTRVVDGAVQVRLPGAG